MKPYKIALEAKKAALDKKALDPVILNVKRISSFTNFLVITHGNSDRHARTIAENIVDDLGKKSERAAHIEGVQEGRWILIDYTDVVIHVFHREARAFYNLERLWAVPPVKKNGSTV